jgi:predicted nucleic acid-binding protein
MKHSVLLDTSFFIRLLNDKELLHENAVGYYKYYLENEITLKISTISIAEYCVIGKLTDLPLRNIQIIPFNFNHAVQTGIFANAIFTENKVAIEKISPRAIIPNDSKLFAQADLDDSITHFVTSDARSQKTLHALKKTILTKFKIIDIATPYHEIYGVLNL